MSKRFEIDLQDVAKWLRASLIIYTPVLILALNQISEGRFDIHIIYASAVSITIDFLRRWLTDYSKNK